MHFTENLNSFEKQPSDKIQLFQIYYVQISLESVMGFIKWMI